MPNEVTAGELLRRWRNQRGLSQPALSINAEVSSRHLCFVETGRANPSREMIVRLAEELQIPLRHRNAIAILSRSINQNVRCAVTRLFRWS